MNKINNPKIKAYELSESVSNFSLQFQNQSEALVFQKNRLPLIRLMNGSRDIKTLWDELQALKSELRLSEIYLTVEKLKKAGALEGSIENSYFKKSWLDFSFFRIKLTDEKKTSFKSKSAFFVAALVILISSLVMIYSNYFGLNFHSFLSRGNSYLFAIPLLIFMLSVLGISKGILKAVLITLASGVWPKTSFCYRGLMLDLEVNESTILIEDTKVQRLYQLSKILCFLFLGGIAGLMLTSDLGRQFQIAALLMTFVWLNPLRKSEFSQAVMSFFDDEQLRHLIPFLQNKSLTAFTKAKNSLAFEKKLIVFSCLSLLWFFLFFDFTESLISTNYAFWVEALRSPSLGQNLAGGVLIFFSAALFISLVIDLFKTMGSNFISHFRKKLDKRTQYQKPVNSLKLNAEQLSQFFSKLTFFSDLSPEKCDQLASIVTLKSYPKKTPIILEGDGAEEMFVLIEGQARVEKETGSGFKQQFALLKEGAVFGEIGLIENRPRSADVVAETAVTLAIIKREAFNSVFEKDLSLPVNALRKKILLSRYLIHSAIFKNLPLETLQLFIQRGVFENFESGSKIVVQGSTEKDFYLLLEGRVAVIRDDEKLSVLLQGDFFGEIALFQNIARTADVVAAENCTLLKLNKDSFWNVLSENMELTLNLEIISQTRSGRN